MNSPDSSGSDPGRAAGWIATIFFVAMTVAVTYPGVMPFNTARPFVLGMPFVLFWYLAWIVGAFFAFLLLYKSRRA